MTYSQKPAERYPLKARVNKRGPRFQYTIYATGPDTDTDKSNITSGTATTYNQALKQANTRMRFLRARQ
ncbi:MAG: hypothetical protein JKY32_07730 [Rhizobiales bacterium]|nr:hypothetical protein [Hyphomicrobiales bacterium]